jgi:hypothetical protein
MKKIAQNVGQISSGARPASASLRNMNVMASLNAWIDQMNKGVVPLGNFTVQNFVFPIFFFAMVCLIARMNPTNQSLPAQTVWLIH